MDKIFFALCCLAAAAPAAAAEAVSFVTRDGCVVKARYEPPVKPAAGRYVFINTHGLGSGKEEWSALEAALKARGYGWLSLDMRGHGGSAECGGKRADYKTFGPRQWSAASADITAAAAFLGKKGIPASRIVICGASIGANLSMKAVAESGLRPAGLVLLSPGLSYAGVETEAYARSRSAVPAFYAAAPDDPYAWKSARRLYDLAALAGSPVLFRSGVEGHGANMFKAKDPALLEEIASMGWAAGKAGTAKP